MLAVYRTLSVRYLSRRWFRALLIVASIALGVATLVATQALNETMTKATLARVNPMPAVAGPPADQVVQYLQRNGVAATLLTVDVAGRTTGEAVLAAAQSLNCDLLVKGAYTQSRLRQLIFGGATRHIIAHATLPVLMAN